MNNLQRGIIDLVQAALTGESVTLPADFDWAAAGPIGVAHSILPMLYYGAQNGGVTLPGEVQKRLESAAMKSLFIDQNQIYEIDRIRTCFVENGIDFMPLKGCLLKALYPRTDMRPMGDADILIKTEQYDAIRPLMEGLGYESKLESDHELVWQKSTLYLELHKRLIPSYNRDYYAYFGDGWKLARKTATTEHVMGDEDQFIYLFTHYAKHYRDSGIGIRHLVDLHLYLQAKPQMDWAYIEQELEKLQLLPFCRNTLSVIDVWFKGAADTALTDFITDRIFGSGSFGTQKNSLLSEGLKNAKSGSAEAVQTRKRMAMVFPSAKALAPKYPVLDTCPWLLPFVWVYRWVAALLFKRDKIRREQDKVNVMTAENISAYQDELNYVGLDFNFEE